MTSVLNSKPIELIRFIVEIFSLSYSFCFKKGVKNE